MAAHARRGDPAPFRRFDRALRALRLADGRKVVTGSDGSLALYDLASDPGELHDLAAARPAEAAELASRLARITGGAESAPPDPPEPSRSSEHEVRRALQSLGYIE
jgi:arylsulfatase A-like enzyme